MKYGKVLCRDTRHEVHNAQETIAASDRWLLKFAHAVNVIANPRLIPSIQIDSSHQIQNTS